MTDGAWNCDEKRCARKVHWCDWCNCAIEPGDNYLRWFGRNDDGDVNGYKMHPERRDAIDRERHLYRQDGISWGEYHKRGMTMDETEAAS